LSDDSSWRRGFGVRQGWPIADSSGSREARSRGVRDSLLRAVWVPRPGRRAGHRAASALRPSKAPLRTLSRAAQVTVKEGKFGQFDVLLDGELVASRAASGSGSSSTVRRRSVGSWRRSSAPSSTARETPARFPRMRRIDSVSPTGSPAGCGGLGVGGPSPERRLSPGRDGRTHAPGREGVTDSEREDLRLPFSLARTEPRGGLWAARGRG